MNGINVNLGSIGPLTSTPSFGSPSSGDNGANFGDTLKNAMQSVKALDSSSDMQIGNLLQGNSTDMSSVMVAVEKADVAFQLMMQVRNKIVNAYQDIEKMQF